MEQLNVMTTQDNDKMFKMLSDLLHEEKEFQIMITVPGGKKKQCNRKSISGSRGFGKNT